MPQNSLSLNLKASALDRTQIEKLMQTAAHFPEELSAIIPALLEALEQERTARQQSEAQLDLLIKLLICNRAQNQLEDLDQSELQQKAEALEEALIHLKQTQAHLVQTEKMSSLGVLIAGIAHEINNPTNFIYGNLQHANHYTQDILTLIRLYRRYYPEPVSEIQLASASVDLEFIMQDFPQLINSINVGAERIQEIVRSLRTFTRVDEHKFQSANIHEGINDTLMILHHRLKATNHRRSITVNKQYGNLPDIECHPGQINQVLLNLLTNAVDAIEDAIEVGLTVVPKIEIITELLDETLISIRIIDNGIGMKDEIQYQLFDPFFTTKPIGKGTGMGLSICYQIITETHQGNIWFASESKQGSEFMLQLPLTQAKLL